MSKTLLILIIVITFVAGTSVAGTPAFAVPFLNPANGHNYELINTGTGITWQEARDAAAASVLNGVNGHLVTISNAAENDFVAGLSTSNFRSWIGFTDEASEGNFVWITGERVLFQNWGPGEPSGDGDFVEFLGSNDQWNDVTSPNPPTSSYVVEFDTPILNPANGHFYELIRKGGITWQDARDAAAASVFNGVNGHLVTITSAAENDFVAGLSSFDLRPWIGLTDEASEGNFVWITGEPFVFQNWDAGEPSGDGDFVEFLGNRDDQWNDIPSPNPLTFGYVVEFDIGFSCGPGTIEDADSHRCVVDNTVLDALQAALAEAQAQRDAILTTLFEFLRVFGVI